MTIIRQEPCPPLSLRRARASHLRAGIDDASVTLNTKPGGPAPGEVSNLILDGPPRNLEDSLKKDGSQLVPILLGQRILIADDRKQRQ